MINLKNKMAIFLFLMLILLPVYSYDKFDIQVCEAITDNEGKDDCWDNLEGDYTGEPLTKQIEKKIAQKKADQADASMFEPEQKIDVSPEMQAKRKDAINKLISMGVFTKIKIPGRLPRLYVN